MLIGALMFVAFALASPASASADRLYVALGDSITGGFGATSGDSFFDLYCAYLESPAGGSRVDRCVNDAIGGLSSQGALGQPMQKVLSDIKGSADTPVVTVDLGGIDSLSTPGCQPITGRSCNFIHNMRTILDQLETALAIDPGRHVIQWLEYYNINHDNPFGTPSGEQSSAAALLGSDFALTPCSLGKLALIGLNDAINCIAQEKGATPVDAYTPFQNNCSANDCFSDSVHPSDKGYQLIFDAFRDTPGRPVPNIPAVDGSWPSPTTISALDETRRAFAPTGVHGNGGTVFTFRLEQATAIMIAIRRTGPAQHTIATLVVQGHPGLNRVAFNGRIHRRPLKPGRYVAVFRTTGPVIVSTSRALQFTIVS